MARNRIEAFEEMNGNSERKEKDKIYNPLNGKYFSEASQKAQQAKHLLQ